jgi:Na+-transporting NADH:ubiquinone oxidoreductase subunit NqrD
VKRDRGVCKEINVTNSVEYVLYIPLNVLEVRCCSNLHFALSQIFRCSANTFGMMRQMFLESSWYGCVETPFGNILYKKVYISMLKKIIYKFSRIYLFRNGKI